MSRRRPPTAAPAPPQDAAAIARLEAEIIPWQGGKDAAARRLREEPTPHPLVAAEGLFRRSARAGAPGIIDAKTRGKPTTVARRATFASRAGPHQETEARAGNARTAARRATFASRAGDPEAERARQNRQLLRWAERHGRLIDRRLEDRLVNLGGVEHEVFLDDATGRWLKLTLPGKAGKELHARETGGMGVRPILVTEDALPDAYLHRLWLCNTRLGDDYWLHGVIAHPGGPRMVVSQRDIVGEPASAEEIERHFVTAGFEPVNAKTFFLPGRNLLVSDAHTANVFKTREGVAPFDVCVQQPQGVLLRAVERAPTLSFDEWEEEQPVLEL